MPLETSVEEVEIEATMGFTAAITVEEATRALDTEFLIFFNMSK